MSSHGATRSPEYLVPGAALPSPRRLQTPAARLRPGLNHAVKYATSGQSAVISGSQLLAILAKPSPAKAAAIPNPHKRASTRRFPAGSFFGGFRTPALYRIDRSCSGRHPKPFPEADLSGTASVSTGVDPKLVFPNALRHHAGYLPGKLRELARQSRVAAGRRGATAARGCFQSESRTLRPPIALIRALSHDQLVYLISLLPQQSENAAVPDQVARAYDDKVLLWCSHIGFQLLRHSHVSFIN